MLRRSNAGWSWKSTRCWFAQCCGRVVTVSLVRIVNSALAAGCSKRGLLFKARHPTRHCTVPRPCLRTPRGHRARMALPAASCAEDTAEHGWRRAATAQKPYGGLFRLHPKHTLPLAITPSPRHPGRNVWHARNPLHRDDTPTGKSKGGRRPKGEIRAEAWA